MTYVTFNVLLLNLIDTSWKLKILFASYLYWSFMTMDFETTDGLTHGRGMTEVQRSFSEPYVSINLSRLVTEVIFLVLQAP